MALYNYEATDSSGRCIKGSLEAIDEQALVKSLREMGYLPIEVNPGREKTSSEEPARLFSRRVSGAMVTAFTHELAGLLEAGLPLDRSLSILAELSGNGSLKPAISGIQKGIQAGKPFAACLEEYPEIFSEVYVNTVKAGEAGGSLEPVLSRLGKFMEEADKLREDIRSALIYPALLLAVGGSAVGLMVAFVIPRFTVIFDDMGAVMPLPARVLFGASKLIVRYWWAAPALSVPSVFALKRKLRTAEGRAALDSFKLRVPFLGRIFRKAAVSRFSRTLGTLLQAGLPILEALDIASRTLGNSSMLQGIGPVIDGVRRGRGISAPLKEVGLFPPLAVHLLTLGEETGRLDEMLIRLADSYDREIGTAVKRALTLLEPAIILVMAILVGFIVISLLLAVFSLNEVPI